MPCATTTCRSCRYFNCFISVLLVHFSLLLPGLSLAQKPYFKKGEIYPDYGKYAYADSLVDGPLIYQYADVEPFSEGVAAVYVYDKEKSKGLWGLIDAKGKYLIEPRYSRITNFFNNYSRVILNGKYGFIDRSGKEIAKLIYDTVSSFSEGLALVRLKNKWRIIDTTGKELNVLENRYAAANFFREGLCWVTNTDQFKGYINTEGKEVIPCIYKYALNFNEGRAKVEIVDPENRWLTKTGFIDKEGKTIVPFRYDELLDFKNGLAQIKNRVKTSGLPTYRYGYVRDDGKEIVPPEYTYLEIVLSKWICGGIPYEKTRHMYDLDGNLLSEDDYEFKAFDNKHTIVRINKKYAVYEHGGKEIIPFKYDFIGPFKSGLAAVKQGNKWGYTNEKDSLVIPLQFEEALPFDGDTALVLNNQKTYVVSTKGKMWLYKVDSSRMTYTTYPGFVFGKNLYGKWHVSSLNNRFVDFYYDNIERYGYELFIATNKSTHSLFILDDLVTKYDISPSVGKRVVRWFDYGFGNEPDGVTKANDRFGLYISSGGREVPAGFADYEITGGSICSFKLESKWYGIDLVNSDFKNGIFLLSHNCDTCKGMGGTAGKINKIRIPGKKTYYPATKEAVKTYVPITLPNGEKSFFRSYEYTEYRTIPGYYKEEPATYKEEYIPGIKCNSCDGAGKFTVKAKWTGTQYQLSK